MAIIYRNTYSKWKFLAFPNDAVVVVGLVAVVLLVAFLLAAPYCKWSLDSLFKVRSDD